MKQVCVVVNQAVDEPTSTVETRQDKVDEGRELIPVRVSHTVSPDEIYVQMSSSDAQKALKRFYSITLHCVAWWCNGYGVGLATKRTQQVQFPAIDNVWFSYQRLCNCNTNHD